MLAEVTALNKVRSDLYHCQCTAICPVNLMNVLDSDGSSEINYREAEVRNTMLQDKHLLFYGICQEK